MTISTSSGRSSGSLRNIITVECINLKVMATAFIEPLDSRLSSLCHRASQVRTAEQIESTFPLLVSNGIDEDITRDFFEPFQSLVRRAIGFQTTSALSLHDLLETFNDPEASNSIVMYLRLLTSTHLKVSTRKFKHYS